MGIFFLLDRYFTLLSSRQFFGKEFPCQTKPKIVIIIIETNFPTKRTLTVPSRQSFWEVWKRFFRYSLIYFSSLCRTTLVKLMDKAKSGSHVQLPGVEVIPVQAARIEPLPRYGHCLYNFSLLLFHFNWCPGSAK